MSPSPFEEPWRYNDMEADMMRQAIAVLRQQPAPLKRSVVDEHAFCHEAGIHQKTVTRNTEAIRARVRHLPDF
ncbi:MAG: hypothetical protein PHH13_01595 [Candidatus Peribacteraceae bacterium]|nr:hypothetical protein [Candidatus Peribacteraceae bacterium]